MRLEIYSVFISVLCEINFLGIGFPAIFIQFKGCNLICPKPYNKKKVQKIKIDLLRAEVRKISENTNIRIVYLTGEEPLYRDPKQLHELFTTLPEFTFLVKTNGSINITNFLLHKHVHWIINYSFKHIFVVNFDELTENDVVKFIFNDLYEYRSFKKIFLELIKEKYCFKVSVLSKLNFKKLSEKMIEDHIFDLVNFEFINKELYNENTCSISC
jgi:organic radical activating enzyme